MLITFIHTPPAQNSSVKYMMEVEEECVSFVNCTGSNFITNWTENNCVNNEGTTSYGSPYMAQNLRYLAFSSIGIMAIICVLVNVLILSSFLYVVTCKTRIKKKFLRAEFSYMQEPIFPLVCHLSVCDILYCLFGFLMIG